MVRCPAASHSGCRRCRYRVGAFRGTKRHGTSETDHSGSMPANLITFVHLSTFRRRTWRTRPASSTPPPRRRDRRTNDAIAVDNPKAALDALERLHEIGAKEIALVDLRAAVRELSQTRRTLRLPRRRIKGRGRQRFFRNRGERVSVSVAAQKPEIDDGENDYRLAVEAFGGGKRRLVARPRGPGGRRVK